MIQETTQSGKLKHLWQIAMYLTIFLFPLFVMYATPTKHTLKTTFTNK